MTTFVPGVGLAPASARMVGRVEKRLRTIGALDGAAGVVVAVGADDAGLAARTAGAHRVLVPAFAGGGAPPWARAVLDAADAVVLFDAAELAALPGPPRAPVVVAGIPRPEMAAAATGLDTGAAPDDLVALWRAEGHPGAAPEGVAWVGGGVVPALCAAAEAWAARRAVVALPGTRPHPLLSGVALMARTPLEVVEATRFLCENRPLARALADRGRRRLTRLDALDLVARRVAEAIVLAGG